MSFGSEMLRLHVVECSRIYRSCKPSVAIIRCESSAFATLSASHASSLAQCCRELVKFGAIDRQMQSWRLFTESHAIGCGEPTNSSKAGTYYQHVFSMKHCMSEFI
eukprot:gnl/TRDRNA2_/TRDRNA2_190765_c0_seq1.p1 gnl/TRDRNA2_/TRDRNA2_190765_c0~~gnl/TRDRNA2_/TRDRNA2_190765_c0_seq1.p1  ORF type:complete len:106 (+),score=8.03 gnl/TRDRNA2_/TRDRNA2_190765_c0_seq1:112-429(+)